MKYPQVDAFRQSKRLPGPGPGLRERLSTGSPERASLPPLPPRSSLERDTRGGEARGGEREFRGATAPSNAAVGQGAPGRAQEPPSLATTLAAVPAPAAASTATAIVPALLGTAPSLHGAGTGMGAGAGAGAGVSSISVPQDGAGRAGSLPKLAAATLPPAAAVAPLVQPLLQVRRGLRPQQGLKCGACCGGACVSVALWLRDF